MQFGEIEVWPALDGRFTYYAEPAGFPPKDSPEFEPHRDYITPEGTYLNDIGAFVVRTGDRLMLIDAGAGQTQSVPGGLAPFEGLADAPTELVSFFRARGLDDEALEPLIARFSDGLDVEYGNLGANIRALGFDPADFTDVVLSHLHFDHIGWVSVDGRPFFPNATYRCERRDADYFLDPELDETLTALLFKGMPTHERMAPVLDRLEPWDGDVNIAPGVDCRFAPGHTPGSSIIVLSSGTQRAMILGDTVHCPMELIDSEFSLMVDMDQELADRTREAIRREIEGDAVPVSAPHFPGLQWGRLLPGQGKRGWTFDLGPQNGSKL